MKTVIIDYGAGNIQSISCALSRLGFTGILSNDPEEIRTADKVIFPGVGHAATAMEKLKASHLDQLIPQLTQPVLGICLGMQLLCNASEEGNTTGLGIFGTAVVQFPMNIKSPQVGWNQIHHLESELFKGISASDYMYFVHGYYAPVFNQTIARTDSGMHYSAAIQKDNFFGVQFHPEKSGQKGELLLHNFLKL